MLLEEVLPEDRSHLQVAVGNNQELSYIKSQMPTKFLNSFFSALAMLSILTLIACSSEKGEFKKAENSSPTEIQEELKALFKQSYAIYATDIDSAIVLSQRALKLCQDNNLTNKTAEWQTRLGAFYRIGGLYSIAENYYNESLEHFSALGNITWVAIAHEERGFNYLKKNEHEKALGDMKAALELWEQLDSTEKIIDTRIDLGIYFCSTENIEMAWKEYQIARKLLDKFQDKNRESRASFLKGDILLLENKYDEAINIYAKLNDPETYSNIGYMYKDWGDEQLASNLSGAQDYYNSARIYHQKSFDFHIKNNATPRLILDYLNLGGIYRRLGDYQAAIDTLNKGIVLAKKNKDGPRLATMFKILSETYENQHERDLALTYYQKYFSINDSIKDMDKSRSTQLAEIHYETDRIEKEKIQAEQKKELREKQLWVSLLIIALVAGLFLFYFYRYRSKKKLMEQQAEINSRTVVDLIKENTIEILDSRLKGQEEERERISRELHDNLGGTLSAVKLSLEGLEEDIPTELKDKYSHTHDLLKQATLETRTLSHEMKALPLHNLGLDDSLESLCETLNVSGKLKGHFSSINPNASVIKQKSQLHLYRICQELIQNVIKHAKAQQVFLQLSYEEDKLILTMEDDGQGFEVNRAKSGMGMKNIQDRVAQINGKLDFDSSIGNGTTVIIEVPTEAN